MALTDAQIDQYSRQILLRQVGGRGQEALLGAGLRVVGEGALFDDAAAYLAGSGIAVEREGAASNLAFPIAQGPARPPTGVVAPAGYPFSADGVWCAVGEDAGERLWVWRTPAGCMACFHRTVERLTAPTDDREPLLSGSLVALAVQAALLGMTDPVSARRLKAAGAVQDQPVTRCDRCAAAPAGR